MSVTQYRWGRADVTSRLAYGSWVPSSDEYSNTASLPIDGTDVLYSLNALSALCIPHAIGTTFTIRSAEHTAQLLMNVTSHAIYKPCY